MPTAAQVNRVLRETCTPDELRRVRECLDLILAATETVERSSRINPAFQTPEEKQSA